MVKRAKTIKSTKLREKSMDWFMRLTDKEKFNMKEKHFPDEDISYSSQWGYHYSFGNIEEMYKKESK